MAGRTDSTRRLFLLLVIFVLGAGLLVVRLGYWQIAQRDDLVASARRQIYYQAPVPSKRGQIYDRSGTVVLAASVVRDRLIVSAQNLDDQRRERMVSFLATQLDLDPAAIADVRSRLATGKPYLVIARDLPPERSEAIADAAATAGIGGISFESDSIRSYPQPGGSPDSSLAANLIGFVNHEGAGQYGVEQYYQDVLAGQPKVVEADRDASGKPIMETERTVTPGVPGEDIRLTIDAGLQLAVEQEVMAARLANDAKSVSAVVMDPWTGEIYAEASYPSYDANEYGAVATADDSVFLDPVVSVVYEPGSVFKMFTVIAGLEQGTTTLQTVYRDTGHLRLDNGKTKVTDADGKAMGNMKLEDGIAYSRNVVASKVALGLAPTTTGASTILHEVWTRFGFGSLTGIDVAGEVRGLVTDPAQRTWRQIDLANGSFGQGVAVTQIQLAAAYAAMVNGGTLVKPHVVAGVGTQAVAETSTPGLIDASMSPTLNGLMQHVLASPWYVDKSQVPGYWIGGKTGTAQVWDQAQNRWLHNVFNFSCVGFIGRTEGHPDLVVAVRIQEAVPARNAQGQLVLPITSTELFRRVATDSITTAGLLAPLDPATVASASSGRAGE
ncbi:MAG TPA: penicillin-binding protein 2 [Candidatus Limnocylindrales bacterium]|nr:penicillin-binding protein 2 [Candidatus Limnocylindrales bacterium]